MSSHMYVSMTAASRELLPKPKAIRKLFARHTDYSFEEFTADDDSNLRIFDEHVPLPGWQRSFTWHNKWETDGVATFAEALSTKYPGVTVRVTHEWDSQDADEQGEEGWEYLDGQLVRRMQNVAVWQEVSATSSTAGQDQLRTPEGVMHSPILVMEWDEANRVRRLEVGIDTVMPDGTKHTTRLVPSTDTGEGEGHGNVFIYSDEEASAHVAWSTDDPLENAVAEFVRVFQSWDGDAFEHLQCAEAESIAAIALAYHDTQLSNRIILLHAGGDDDERDQHHDLFIQNYQGENPA